MPHDMDHRFEHRLLLLWSEAAEKEEAIASRSTKIECQLHSRSEHEEGTEVIDQDVDGQSRHAWALNLAAST